MWLVLAACTPDDRAPPRRDDAAVAPSGDTGGERPPNLLLVVIDDVGVDRLRPYGNEDARTPHLDALAARGRVFRHAWAYASCSPARAALVTGRHARRTGYGSNVEPPDVYRLDPAQTTIAEVLRAAPVPYATAFLGKWHLETAREGWGGPRSQGWDRYAGSQSNLVGDYFSWQKRGVEGGVFVTDVYATTDTANDAITAMTTLPEPWFVTASFNAPHPPFHTPPASLATIHPSVGAQRSVEVELTEMLEAWDTEFGRVLDALPPTVRDRTWIVVIGDNGDPITDGQWSAEGGKLSLAEGGVHVPLIVAGPGIDAPGPSDALVSVVDLFPTFAELGGADLSGLRAVRRPTEPLELDGRSLVPALRDPAAEVHEVILSERFTSGPPPFESYEVAARSLTHKVWRDEFHVEHLYVFDDPDPAAEPRELRPEDLTPADVAAAKVLRDALRAHAHQPWDASE